MNDKTNFLGYSQTLGVATGTSTTTAAHWNGTDGCYITTTPGWATPLNGGTGVLTHPSNNLGLSIAVTNSNNMTKQVKVAVFTVERSEDNKVTSSKLYGEFWVEVKNGSSLDLAVAKQIKEDYDPANTIIKELYTVTF